MATRITASTPAAEQVLGQVDMTQQKGLEAIAAINLEIADMDVGLGIIDAATTNQVRAIVAGLLASHRKTLVRQRAIIRYHLE